MLGNQYHWLWYPWCIMMISYCIINQIFITCYIGEENFQHNVWKMRYCYSYYVFDRMFHGQSDKFFVGGEEEWSIKLTLKTAYLWHFLYLWFFLYFVLRDTIVLALDLFKRPFPRLLFLSTLTQDSSPLLPPVLFPILTPAYSPFSLTPAYSPIILTLICSEFIIILAYPPSSLLFPLPLSLLSCLEESSAVQTLGQLLLLQGSSVAVL